MCVSSAARRRRRRALRRTGGGDCTSASFCWRRVSLATSRIHRSHQLTICRRSLAVRAYISLGTVLFCVPYYIPRSEVIREHQRYVRSLRRAVHRRCANFAIAIASIVPYVMTACGGDSFVAGCRLCVLTRCDFFFFCACAHRSAINKVCCGMNSA